MPERLTKTIIDKHIADSKVWNKKKEKFEVKRTELADTGSQGLIVRINQATSDFAFRWTAGKEKRRLVLGPYSNDGLSIDAARRIANKATDLVRQGFDPDEEWLRQLRNPQTVAPVRRVTWTWTEAREAYLDEIGGPNGLKPATVDDYRKALHHRAFKPFERRFVCDLTNEDLSEALAAYQRRQKGDAADGLRRRVRPFWKFLQRMDIRRKSGVTQKIQIDLPAHRSTAKAQVRWPHPADVAALYVKASAGELGYASRAVVLLCLTAQRRATIVSVSPKDVQDGVWNIPPVHRKTAAKRGDNRIHALPWPAEVAVGNHDQFVFPADRPRRAGDPLPHTAASTLTHALRDAGLGFSPHDIRRSFQTTMSILKIKESPVMVLDHNEGPKSTADTFYDAYRDLPEKRAMLQVWRDFLTGERIMSDEDWFKHTGHHRIGRKKAA